MNETSNLRIWLIVGSQHLYGTQALQEVEAHAHQVASGLSESGNILLPISYHGLATTPEDIHRMCLEANASHTCIGVILWMHTFSPAKMWINGLKILRKPLLHLHTQFNRDIPWGTIDMDFMNLNQSAHGDRELGHLMTRMGINRAIVVGHWRQPEVQQQIDVWCRAALAWHDWQGARFVRFGDNMRQVAVTEGDKVEAEYRLGFSVNTHGVGDLVKEISAVSEKEIHECCELYDALYRLQPELRKGGAKHASLQEAARIELGLRKFLQQGGYKGFTDTFEDLHGLKQLPGIAVQRLMQEGYGFGAEGDWKTAALVRAMKVMAIGLPGGNSFMEDYTYHLEPGNELVLGAHMLEVCPSITDQQPSCEVHPLHIGGKDDPVRLVFNAAPGPALNASLVDMGNHFRLLVNEVEAIRPPQSLPKLPVARAVWKPYPNFQTACAAWILAGGAHHTCFSQNLTQAHLRGFATIAGLEYVAIDQQTQFENFAEQLRWKELYYGLKGMLQKSGI
ncbi:MAG: L-arabinose isomerase [Thermoflavifilum sp.]|nr:L-arabinose isomerase [Thermoflavifilum sp.]